MPLPQGWAARGCSSESIALPRSYTTARAMHTWVQPKQVCPTGLPESLLKGLKKSDYWKS